MPCGGCGTNCQCTAEKCGASCKCDSNCQCTCKQTKKDDGGKAGGCCGK